MEKIILILLIDRKHGHFYRYALDRGRLEILEEIADEVPRPTKSASWAGLADDKVARHIEAHVKAHFRRVIERLEHYLRVPDFEVVELMLGGPEAEVDQFQTMLPKSIRDRISSVIHPDHYAGIKELENQIATAAAAAARARVHEVLAQIQESLSPNGRGVIGREPVLEALNLKQVQILILDPKATFAGMVCPKDGCLSQSLTKCPLCLSPMEQRSNLIAEIKKLAALQDAIVLEAPDSSELAAYEGLAALRRYSD